MFADRYELGAVLGRGGMAEVYEAVAHGTHGFLRRVAIKRLLPQFSEDAHLVRMFLDEARTISHLHHSGIVSVLDFGVVDGCPFQVLELVEGWDAARLVRLALERGKKMPIDVALVLTTQVAHALAYAHERKDATGRLIGIVHRDVKPSNILVSSSGDIKLGDFGIALARERSAVTTGFVARGTPGYMSPEQLLGQAVGPTADVFSVGISLYGLLTGAPPLKSDSHRAILAGEELTLPADLPLDVREIIVRAVRMRPDERYGSARELARAVGEVLAPRLETDPTSRITQWLEEVVEAERPTPQRPTTAILVPMAAPGQFSLQVPPTLTENPSKRPHEPVPKAALSRASDISGLAPLTPISPLSPPTPVLSPTFDEEPPPSRTKLMLAPKAAAPVSSSRTGTIFAIATLVPLGLAVIGLVVFLFVRSIERARPSLAAPSITPDAAIVPSASASATEIPSLVEQVEPEDPSEPRGGSAPGQRGKANANVEVVASQAVWKQTPRSNLDKFNASPAEIQRSITAMTNAVQSCVIKRRVRRGARVSVVLSVDTSGVVAWVGAYPKCDGQHCSAISPTIGSRWLPDESIECVIQTMKSIRFPGLRSTGFVEDFAHDFLVR